ncbi:MAG: glutamate synthase large subunit [Calditrichia bacterium]
MKFKEWIRQYHGEYPEPDRLYHPQYEKDACGVGVICNIEGKKEHDVVHKALEILNRLTHRGATGSDPDTGDGAGIMIQIPHAFYKKVLEKEGITLPDEGEYATGLIFLPHSEEAKKQCMNALEEAVVKCGQQVIAWRKLPVDRSATGTIAAQSAPDFWQVFIRKTDGSMSQADFERKCFIIRKMAENQVRTLKSKEKKHFYIPSLSSRTIVFKGLLLPSQMEKFYPDLTDPDVKTAVAMVHQRYSTNTFPSWQLAQPFRLLCHNGEINTLRGNVNWLLTRQSVLKSELFGQDLEKIFPIPTPGGSDSAILDNAAELLVHGGRSLPHAIMMLIPEAWQKNPWMNEQTRAFYEYHACLMEPWDGPAFVPFTDGRFVGAVLDRNGLRPARYTVTKSGWVIMASETGVLEIPDEDIQEKGRLKPGKMFLVDMQEGRIVDDEEIKMELSSRQPYQQWLDENLIRFDHLPAPRNQLRTNFTTIIKNLQKFGYSQEDVNMIIKPMAETGKEPIGSMGDDTPLAVLSDKPRLLYDYFKQLFAQVTNPPLDAIREEMVTSLTTYMGNELNLLEETPKHAHLFKLEQPLLTNDQLQQIREMVIGDIRSITLPMLYKVSEGGKGLEQALENLSRAASRAVDEGITIIILSDRNADENLAPIPAALAVSAVHHHLVDEEKRSRCGIVVESGEPREVHHFCVLLGYGASAVNPYLAYEAIDELIRKGQLKNLTFEQAVQNYQKAVNGGIVKVMSKMGISTLQSYQAAQIFEIIGISKKVTEAYFSGSLSRIGGIGLEEIAEEVRRRYKQAYPGPYIKKIREVTDSGIYKWRRRGEHHLFNPITIAKLQEAVRKKDYSIYKEYSQLMDQRIYQFGHLRSLFQFKTSSKPIPLEEVEPWTEIVKRFKTGAMSYGSISKEAHETMAIAMNSIGGKSNSGEGGEDPERYIPTNDGTPRYSAIKQVASGRFGVNLDYLLHANELQIKIAQGAKPGEGGQLPAHKVLPWIAKTRFSTPFVGLISPPPHHDIYSIEDLAQLIFDLKNANSDARINVKLVSEAGVGTIAVGVAKARADVILISGHDGGTGASPLTSIRHAGLPWELGLAETHQSLVKNGLRKNVVLECDGKLKTGRDVAIAACLGAEEFGFATAPLISMGCIMMRVCHKNTCPVGIATQDPELRKKFRGQPEHVINFMYFVALELREIMAALGFRTVDEMVGRSDKLTVRRTNHWKAKTVDMSALISTKPNNGTEACHFSTPHESLLTNIMDKDLVKHCKRAIEHGEKVELSVAVRNINRTVGTLLSSEIIKKHGVKGLPDDTIRLRFKGSAGQSFAAFAVRGITISLEGDANDYLGKGLSGARLAVYPPANSTFQPNRNIIVGNVAFYGGISGEAFIRGVAGERFCVRNSGVQAVVEGVGDHGCEYMTGGIVVVLGKTGRNFAAGMSGGIAYVYDEAGDFAEKYCNQEMVLLEAVVSDEDQQRLKKLIENHKQYTGSDVATYILANWDNELAKFVKVFPVEYKLALERMAESRELITEH